VHATHTGWNSIGNLQTTAFEIKNHIIFENGVEDEYEQIAGVYVLNKETNTWEARRLEEQTEVGPYVGMFVQVATQDQEGIMTFSGDGRSLHTDSESNLYRSSKHNNNGTLLELRLYGNDENRYDRLIVFTKDTYSNLFVAGEDAMKFLADINFQKPEFYTIVESYPMAFNKLQPLSAQEEIPMGLIIKEAGNYTITISDITGYEGNDVNVYLIDKELGIIHNLSETDYVFESAPIQSETRYALRISNAPTSILSPVSNVIAYAQDNMAIVKNIKVGDAVSIYNISGQLISRSIAVNSEVSYQLPGTGIYIVKVSGYNSFVSKLINK
jgi:hypothetical protein